VERPLSTYVIISLGISAWGFYSNYSTKDKCTFTDDATIPFSTLTLILMASALVNVFFAFYFQYQVWKRIMDQKDSFEDVEKNSGGMLAGAKARINQAAGRDQGTLDLAPSYKPDKVKVPAMTVRSSFKDTFMQDFVVLAYVFLSIGIFVVAFMGGKEMDDGSTKPQPNGINTKPLCNKAGREGWAYWSGYLYFSVFFTYVASWYCCNSCAKSVTVENDTYAGLDATE